MLHKIACYEFPSFVGLQQLCDPHSARSGTECDPDNLSFPCCIFSKIAGHELVMQSLASSLYNQSNGWWVDVGKVVWESVVCKLMECSSCMGAWEGPVFDQANIRC